MTALPKRADRIMTKEQLEHVLAFGTAFLELQYGQALLLAALAGSLDLAFLQRAEQMPQVWQAGPRNLPLVVALIDTFGKPAGPSIWRSAVSLIAWAEIVVLQQAGAEKLHYGHAAELAKTHLRVLLVEAPAEGYEDWLDLLHGRAGLAVKVMR